MTDSTIAAADRVFGQLAAQSAVDSSGATLYTAGFLFTDSLSHVMLIEKKRPTKLAGMWNAIGGHVEDGESPGVTQRREFEEEAGIVIKDWTKYATLELPRKAYIWFFYALAPWNVFESAKQMTDEKVASFSTTVLHAQHYCRCVPNLQYLIPMAMCHANDVGPKNYRIIEDW